MASKATIASGTNNSEDIEFNVRASDMANDFSNIFIRKTGDMLWVQLTFLLDPADQKILKAWKTGVALDASASMKKMFGRQLVGHLPANIVSEYEQKGWMTREYRDGRKVRTFTRQAVDDALKRNLVSLSTNTMDYVGSEITAYLSKNLAKDGSSTVIYWSGGNGREIEEVGEINEAACANLNLDGPDKMSFGNGTQLLPAVKYFVEHCQRTQPGIFVFLTDGRIEDLDEVKDYTAILAQDILTGQRSHLKFVLVGVGDEIDESQWRLLDKLDGQNFANLWDQMIVTDFQDMLKIFNEVLRNTQIVALQGTLLDDSGKTLKQYPDGMPGQVFFSMPASASGFKIEMDGRQISQPISIPNYR
ncbi:MAG: VWA domain-containing protein [Syntrophomonadaceae bacterium]|nr:VWA domain-containing protein [Syntrophomonadaceae bacterium]